MRRHLDLERASAAAILCAFVVIAFPWEAVRLAAALPLALFLPGYAINAAAFGKRHLEPGLQLLLALGSSLAALVVAALLLSLAPGGLRGPSWAILLLLVVVAACRIAALRRPGWRARRRRAPRPKLGRLDAALLSAGALLAAAALVLAETPLPAKHAVGYTALWMLPGGGVERRPVRIGVVSEEQRRTAYRLEVRLGDGRIPVSEPFVLQPGQSRVIRPPLPRLRPVASRWVVALLYRQEYPAQVYRRVTARLPRGGTP